VMPFVLMYACSRGVDGVTNTEAFHPHWAEARSDGGDHNILQFPSRQSV